MSSMIVLNDSLVCEEEFTTSSSILPCLDYVQYQETTKSQIPRRIIRGRCALPFACATLFALLALLTILFIEYLIYVYGFNAGDWRPFCNNCSDRGIAMLCIMFFGPPVLTLIGSSIFVSSFNG